MEADERREGGTDDLGLGDEGRANAQNPMVRKAISLKLKPQKVKGKGEPKQQDLSASTSELKYPAVKDHKASADKLSWDHKVELFGEKVIDPLIHCCEQCQLPILIYGRMIPCKHVYCLDCARRTTTACPRCGDPVQRIEECALGTVFLCTFGGAKHGVSGCRRTYLSPRDLQAHVTHRHVKLLPPPPPPPIALQQPLPPLHVFSPAAPVTVPPPAPPSLGLDARTLPPPSHVPTTAMPFLHPMHHRVNLSQPPPTGAANVPIRSEPRETFSVPLVRTSSNLITIPIQDDIEFSASNASSSGSSNVNTFSQPPQLHYSQQTSHAAAIAPFSSTPAVPPYPVTINSGSQVLHPSMLTMHHAMPPPPQPHLGQPVPGVQPPIAASIQPQGTFVPVPAQVTAQWGRQPPPSPQQHGMQPYY